MTRTVLLVFLFDIVMACSKHRNFVPVYSVPAGFQPYVDTFIKEAAKRGHFFKINNLIIQYDKVIDSDYCGQCNSRSLTADIQKTITVNRDIKCSNNDQEFEDLLFHELGHCILGRGHTGALLPNGNPKSIMVPGNLGLYSPCIYPIGGGPCDNTFKRAYYLDELFDEKTPVPAWAK